MCLPCWSSRAPVRVLRDAHCADPQAGGRAQAAAGASIPYSVGRAPPDKIPGWERGPKITMYGPSSLWEYIDGAAEQYLAYEFQDLATATYTRAAGGACTVEIYRMLDAVHAFGIYAQELGSAAARVEVGVEGRAGKNGVKFWSNELGLGRSSSNGMHTYQHEAD